VATPTPSITVNAATGALGNWLIKVPLGVG
jgi:hypothetical protein